MEGSVRYNAKEFAKKIGVTPQTLVRWDKQGILVADRTLGGRPVYTEKHLKMVEEKGV